MDGSRVAPQSCGSQDEPRNYDAYKVVDSHHDVRITPLHEAWVRPLVIDRGSVIVHVFAPDEREFYGLERLWSNAPQVVRVV